MNQPDSSSLLLERIRRGLSTIVLGPLPPLPKTVGLVRVRCDVPGTLAPLDRARERIERLLEGDVVPGAAGPSARRMVLGDDARRSSDDRLAAACNRLASRAPGRLALVLEGIDQADASTHAALARLLRVPARLRLPLVLVISEEPSGSFLELVQALGQASHPPVEGASAPGAGRRRDLATERLVAEGGEPGRTEALQRLDRLDPEVRRTLRAAAVVGHAFDADLVARVLERPVDAVLESLQVALDAGFPIHDTGDGSLEMPREVAAALTQTMLGPLRKRWQERLGDLLGATSQDGSTSHDPLRSAAHLDDAGQRERAIERRFDAVAMMVRAGDVRRGSEQLEAALADLAALPRGAGATALGVRAKVERARVRWLGAGLDPSFTLAGALDAAFEARADLGRMAPASVQADLASMIAGIAYDLGDGASVERAHEALTESVAALLRDGATVEAASLLNDQGALQLRMGRTERAAELLGRSLELLTARVEANPSDLASRADLADTHHLLARLPLHRGADAADDAITSALVQARAAEVSYQRLGMRRDVARVTETVARLYAKRGDMVEARAAFAAALRIADDVTDLTGLARITAGIAELLSSEGTPRDALGMLTSSIELNREKGSPIGLAFDERILEEVERAVASMPSPDPGLAAELARARERLVAAIEQSSPA